MSCALQSHSKTRDDSYWGHQLTLRAPMLRCSSLQPGVWEPRTTTGLSAKQSAKQPAKQPTNEPAINSKRMIWLTIMTIFLSFLTPSPYYHGKPTSDLEVFTTCSCAAAEARDLRSFKPRRRLVQMLPDSSWKTWGTWDHLGPGSASTAWNMGWEMFAMQNGCWVTIVGIRNNRMNHQWPWYAMITSRRITVKHYQSLACCWKHSSFEMCHSNPHQCLSPTLPSIVIIINPYWLTIR